MGPEDSGLLDGMEFYLGDTRLGNISEIESKTITLSEGADENEPIPISRGVTLRFTSTHWTTCRSRKRFIKLMGGVFGMPKREAETLAREAMRNGCPSYSDLWADCFSYITGRLIHHMLGHDIPVAMLKEGD